MNNIILLLILVSGPLLIGAASSKNNQLRFADPVTDTLQISLINENLQGSKTISTRKLKQFRAVEWILGNNAKVVFKKVGFEKDNILLTAYSLGGNSLYDVDLLPSAAVLPAIVEQSGSGDLDKISLQKMLSGKNVSANINLGELTEGITGSSSINDFETMMQLLYLRFEKPRFDKEAYNIYMAKYATFLKNMAEEPSKIMQDSLSLFLTNFNPRTMVMNPDVLKKVDFEKIRKIYSERFKNASDFIFFIAGDIEEKTARLMAEKYIGSIKVYDGTESFIDRKVMPPKGKFVKEVQLSPAIPKSTIFISHCLPLNYTSYNNVTLKVIQAILGLVFTEKARKEAGSTNDISINISSQKYPVQQATSLIMFDSDPAKADDIKALVYRELDKLAVSGPTKENLEKTVDNFLKNRDESRLHNSYWMNALYAYYFTGVDVNDHRNYEEILKKLTVDDIKKMAQLFFSNSDLAEIVFRPKAINGIR